MSRSFGSEDRVRIDSVHWRRLLGGVGAAVLLAAAAAGIVDRAGRTLGACPAIHSADAIVVLGGEWPNRIQRGIELYQLGLAPEIWITGDGSGAGNPGRSAEVARRAGVPAEAIRLLLSSSTWEDGGVAATLAAWRDLRSVLVVTSWYHGRRALCVMKRRFAGSGVLLYHDTVGTWQSGTDSSRQDLRGWYRVARELVASVWYWADHDLNPWSC